VEITRVSSSLELMWAVWISALTSPRKNERVHRTHTIMSSTLEVRPSWNWDTSLVCRIRLRQVHQAATRASAEHTLGTLHLNVGMTGTRGPKAASRVMGEQSCRGCT